MAKGKGPVANVKRSGIPHMFVERGSREFRREYIEYLNDLQVCYDLVAITGSILGKNLKLIAGTERQGIFQARTYGNIIELPKTHPNRRIATKHELSHHYGESDAELRYAFCDVLVGRIEYESGKQIPAVLRERLLQELCLMNNVFDDGRVNSLWGLVYPGDGREMDEWYYGTVGPQMMKTATQRFGDDITDLMTFLILIALKQDAKSERWGKYADLARDARDRCLYTTFTGSLVVMRNLLMAILTDIASDLDDDQEETEDGQQPNLGAALAKIATDMPEASFHRKFASDDGGFDTVEDLSPGNVLEKRKEASNLLDVDDDFLLDAETTALTQIEGIKSALSDNLAKSVGNAYTDSDEWLTKTVKAEVEIHKPTSGDLRAYVMSREDELIVQKWRNIFSRVLSSAALTLEEDGDELNVEAFLQGKLSGEWVPCYERETAARGYRLNLLIDMSGSMWSTFNQVERLTAVLRRSLKFPFTRVGVWGFKSTAKGTVNMVRYPDGALGLVGAGAQVGGITPLSHAIQIAGRDLMTEAGENHVFVLSDGMPVYQLKDRPWMVSTKMLTAWVRDAVLELKSRNVRTHCFMMGDSVPRDSDMDFMFGERAWKKIPENDMFEEAHAFIMQQFMRYLRNR